MARQIDPSFHGDDLAAWHLILKALALTEPLLAELREALARPEIVWPLDYSVPLYGVALPQIGIQLRIARIFRTRALAEIATGDFYKAFEDTQTLLALARISKEPPIVIGKLVEKTILKMAAEVINEGLLHGAWNEDQLTSVSASLLQVNLLTQYAKSLRLERICDMQWCASKRKPSNFNNFPFTHWTPLQEELFLSAWRFRPLGWAQEDSALCIMTQQQMIESLGDGAALGSRKIWEELSRQKNFSVWSIFMKPMSFLGMAAEANVAKHICQTQTMLNSLSAACAVTRYRLANHHLPVTLEELVPALLPAVPNDPMTGGKLLYKPSPDGSFVIYGLGWNRKDEGGPKVSSYKKQPEEQSNWGIVVTPPQ